MAKSYQTQADKSVAAPVFLIDPATGAAVAGGTGGASGAGSINVVPVVGTAHAIATGGTAVVVVTGPVNGGYISNPVNADAQGIAVAENAYVDPVGTPGSTDAAANGTTSMLQPGQSFSIPALATGAVIKANAASSGHKLNIVVW